MRTEAIVESFEASLREAFQQLQGGANAIPWWERKSLAQGMTESFVVGTASETAFLLVALLPIQRVDHDSGHQKSRG